RRFHACADLDATDRRGRRHPGAGRQAWRHIQHGWCGRRQLRVHPGSHQMKQSAVVTGGASGIGMAIARRLLDDGWPVAIIDVDEQALMAAEDEFADDNAIFLQADVTDEDEVDAALDEVVDRLGLIGGLVNAAGISREAAAEDTSAELLRELLDVNLVGTFIAAKAALERMGEALSIVNIGSVSGMRANRGHLAYGTSKAGVKLMSEVLAL